MKDLPLNMLIASGILLMIVARWLSNFDLETHPYVNDLQLACALLGLFDVLGAMVFYYLERKKKD